MAGPELLPADAETIEHCVDELTKKEEIIDELLQRSKTQRPTREASGEVASLVAQITKMDLDRTRFMLVDLARTRMAKIENHALHNRTLVDRMTEEEVRITLKVLHCGENARLLFIDSGIISQFIVSVGFCPIYFSKLQIISN